MEEEAMANYQALGTGPVSFVDAHQKQQQIPLSAITFSAGDADASAWSLWSTISSGDQGIVKALLTQLVSQGLLTPGTQTAPTPSLTVTAAQPGTTGNVIVVTFAAPNPAAGTVNVTVSANEVYPGLTLATLSSALGTSAATANGLVFLQGAPNKDPASFSGAISGGPAFDCLVTAADGDPAGAFTLAATNTTNPTDASNIQIEVTPDPLPATTFTLTASWKKPVTGATLAVLETPATNPFAMLVTFAGPVGGPLPAAGTVTLQGGAAATSTPEEAATAKVFSS
jgi:hypothetical protein